MKTSLIASLLLSFVSLAVAQSDVIPLQKKRSDNTLIAGFDTGAKTIKISAAGTLEWVNGATLTGASYFRTAAGLIIGTNVQAYDADLTTIAALANAAGVLTNNGSGVFSYTATSTGGNGTDDSGKIAKFNTLGQIAGGFVGSFEAGPSYNFVAMDEGLRIGSETNAGTFGVPAGGGTSLVWTLPSVTGTFVTTGDTGSVTNTMLAGSIALTKLLQSSATSGQVIAWNGSAWAPATISSGLTIGSTAISGGTSGRLLLSGTTLAELTLGSGVQTALGNTVNASGGLLTYGLIGTSGTKIPLLDGANTFSGSNTFAAGTITTNQPAINVTQDWNNGAVGFKAMFFNITTTAADYSTTAFMEFQRNGSTVMRMDHGGSMLWASSGMFWDTNSYKVQVPAGGYFSINGDVLFIRDAAGVLALKNTGYNNEVRTYDSGSTKYASLKHDGSTGILSSSSGGIKVGTAGTAIAHIKRTTATLVAGTVTVTDADTSANTHVIITVSGSGGTAGDLSFTVSAGASYTVNSTSATDTRTLTITAIHYP